MDYEFHFQDIDELDIPQLEDDLRFLLKHALKDKHTADTPIHVTVARSPADPYDEAITGQVRCGDSVVGSISGTLDSLTYDITD